MISRIGFKFSRQDEYVIVDMQYQGQGHLRRRQVKSHVLRQRVCIVTTRWIVGLKPKLM